MSKIKCIVCDHRQIRKINDELLSGRRQAHVARAYGIHVSSMNRHWKICLVDQISAAKEARRTSQEEGFQRINAIDGEVLLGQAATIHQRAVSLLDELESRMYATDEDGNPLPVDTRSVVAALRETRQSLESLAKLNYQVADRPAKQERTSRPEIDSCIMEALSSRGLIPDKNKQEAQELRVLELPAHVESVRSS